MGRILHAFVHFCSMPHLSIMPWRYLVDCVYGRVAYKKDYCSEHTKVLYYNKFIHKVSKDFISMHRTNER